MSNVELYEKDEAIMNVYCKQLLQDNKFRQLLNHKAPAKEFYQLGAAVKDSLAVDVYPESLLPISEVYILLRNTGYIVSPNYFTQKELFFTGIKGYPPKQYVPWLDYLTDASYYNTFIPMNKLIPTSSKEFYMYVINLDDIFYLKANGVVCFVIDGEKLMNLFDYSPENAEFSFVFASNANDTPFLALRDPSMEELTIEKLQNLNYANDFASINYNSISHTVGKYTSPVSGNTYYYGFPSFEATSNIIWYQRLYMFIFAVALFAGGFLVTFFSRRNVRPIVELGIELQGAVDAQNHLQEVVDSQRPIICTSYIKQIFTGTLTSEDEALYVKDFLNIKGDDLTYNVLYIVAYNNSGEYEVGSGMNFSNPEDFNNVIYDALQSYLGTPLYQYSPSDRTYAVLLSCEASESDSFIMKIQDLVLRLHDYLLDTYGIWLFASIGKNTDSLVNLWESYQQSVEAVSYTTKNYIFYPYEFIKKDSNVFYYPPEISTKLIHFITTGNASQVLELFNLIHEENIEERSLPINLLKFLLSDIRNSLLRARFALPSNTPKEAIDNLDKLFNEHLSFKLCEDLALTLCKLFVSESQDSNLATTIEKYIIQNYKDPSLCLNKISDEFQISETYFSHMFKEKTGANFSIYLENIRMSEAMRLIKETNISLNELYLAVGYNNPNTFRRVFKKTFGVPPSNVRE